MEELVPEIIEWVEIQPVWSIYFILLFVAYLENVFPPIPGDVMVVFGGYLITEGALNFPGLLATTTFGSVLGFMNLYYIGYLAGDHIRSRNGNVWFLKFLNPSHLDTTERWMIRWGQGVVVVNRFLTGARSIISLVAGMTRLDPSRTAVFATIGAAAWNMILIAGGWFIGDNWQIIRQYLNVYGQFIISLIVIGVGIRVAIYYYEKQKQKPTSDTKP